MVDAEKEGDGREGGKIDKERGRLLTVFLLSCKRELAVIGSELW